jgi:hypothetical protein
MMDTRQEKRSGYWIKIENQGSRVEDRESKNTNYETEFQKHKYKSNNSTRKYC